MKLNRKQFLATVSRGVAGGVAASTLGTTGAAAQATAPPAAKKLQGAAIAGTTDALVGYIRSATLRDMPAAAIARGKECLVDGFGVMLAGSTLPGSGIVRDYIATLTDKREATVLGRGGMMAPASYAAMANGASGHAMDYDDTQLSTTPDRTYGLLTHPTMPPLSAALAVAERSGASGAAFLEAFLIGFEVECKIAEAIDPDHYRRGFHSSGTIGAFGAGAAAAKLLRLSDQQTRHMLTIVSSLSSGIRVNFGSMTKPLHVARAAENGVLAAELAARGFTGGDDGLDGQWGFFQVLGGGADPERLLHVLGRPYTIVDPGVSFKPYPSGVLSHQAMDAMLAVVTTYDLQAEQIAAVRLRAGNNILEPLRYKTATTELEAKFCLPFLLASIILRRKAGIHEFTDEFVASSPVQRLMPRISGVFDPQIEAQGFDKIRSVVEVDLVDGRKLVQAADLRYRGGPDKPFTRDELHAKFSDCAQLVMSTGQIAQALTAIDRVETLASARELVTALAAGSRAPASA